MAVSLALRYKENPLLFLYGFIGFITGIMFYFLPFLTMASILAIAALSVLTVYRLEAGIFFCLLFPPIELHALEILPWFVKYFDEFLLIVMIVVVFYRIFAGEEKFKPTPLGLPILAFIFVGLLSILFNRVPIVIGIAGLRAMLQYILLYYVMVHSGLKPDTCKRLIALILLVAVITVFYGVFQRLIGLEAAADWEMRRFHDMIRLRVFSTMANPNTYGAYLVTMIALACNLLIYYYKHRKEYVVMFLILIALLFLGLQLTYSRMSLLSLAASMATLLLLYKRKYLPVFAAGAMMIVVLLPSSYFDRLLFVLSPEYIALSLKGGRLFLMQKAWEVISHFPILGAGPGMFGGSVAGIFNSPLYEAFAMPYHMNLDNFFFQVWAELGTLGLICFLWMFKTMFVQAFTTYSRVVNPFWKSIAAGSLTFLTAIVVQSFVAGIWEVHQVAVYIWFFAGLIYLSQNLWSDETNYGGQKKNENAG